MIRVMIVAKHSEVREGLSTILGLAAGIEIVEVVSRLSDARSLDAATCPGVALVDLEMPVGEGYETVRRLKQQHPQIKVIALTAHDYSSARESATQAGADEVMVKGLGLSEMVAGIEMAYG